MYPIVTLAPAPITSVAYEPSVRQVVPVHTLRKGPSCHFQTSRSAAGWTNETYVG